MRELISRVTYWTYSLIYGLSQGTPQFNLKHINGSGLGGSYLGTLITSWLTTRTKLTTLLGTSVSWLKTRSYFRRYQPRHQSGIRQTYAGRTALRAQRELAWHNWQAFLDMRTAGTVGIATYPVVGDRAYRRLSPSILNRETRELIRKYAPRDWLDD